MKPSQTLAERMAEAHYGGGDYEAFAVEEMQYLVDALGLVEAAEIKRLQKRLDECSNNLRLLSSDTIAKAERIAELEKQTAYGNEESMRRELAELTSDLRIAHERIAELETDMKRQQHNGLCMFSCSCVRVRDAKIAELRAGQAEDVAALKADLAAVQLFDRDDMAAEFERMRNSQASGLEMANHFAGRYKVGGDRLTPLDRDAVAALLREDSWGWTPMTLSDKIVARFGVPSSAGVDVEALTADLHNRLEFGSPGAWGRATRYTQERWLAAVAEALAAVDVRAMPTVEQVMAATGWQFMASGFTDSLGHERRDVWFHSDGRCLTMATANARLAPLGIRPEGVRPDPPADDEPEGRAQKAQEASAVQVTAEQVETIAAQLTGFDWGTLKSGPRLYRRIALTEALAAAGVSVETPGEGGE